MKKIVNEIKDQLLLSEVKSNKIIAFRTGADGLIYVLVKSSIKLGEYRFVCITNMLKEPMYQQNQFFLSVDEAICQKHDVYAFDNQFEFSEWMLSFKTRLHGIDTNIKS